MSQNEAARTQAGIDFKAIQAEELKQLKATDRPNALFGLCLSGGGIRSATFNLGVLEVLEEKGLLNQLDYLSTVSGGGYIGSYVLANRKRKQGVGPDNESSLQHLRRFSNYLAPDASMFSLDTWTMIAIWLRNTTLLQGFLISLLAAVLLLPRLWAGGGLELAADPDAAKRFRGWPGGRRAHPAVRCRRRGLDCPETAT